VLDWEACAAAFRHRNPVHHSLEWSSIGSSAGPANFAPPVDKPPAPTPFSAHIGNRFSHKPPAIHTPFASGCGSGGKYGYSKLAPGPVFQIPSNPHPRFRKPTPRPTPRPASTSPYFLLFLAAYGNYCLLFNSSTQYPLPVAHRYLRLAQIFGIAVPGSPAARTSNRPSPYSKARESRKLSTFSTPAQSWR
jgi:hypothetical protein